MNVWHINTELHEYVYDSNISKYQFQVSTSKFKIFKYILLWIKTFDLSINPLYKWILHIFLPGKDQKKAQGEYWQDKINHEESLEDTKNVPSHFCHII